ncbi:MULTISPECIES: phosphonate metabolism protein/1,5-bisphosphokinase (PRPP-forming) PhnN [unclassified Limnohabitans]|jgi:ribose 1,5-bisphosphokinase|uniref:phosphonate metabolism protein/1,5-bisphosphokinase (PRPP-forming) PhnN n=1 Tax=unclassified Limnohabitans TaxID=2626134 RepID=UPI0005912126|nr:MULTISPECIES: phosphonate metabolism protein/1,5-bisphosphokinase (PRPP-forming) PhnN [unclassified Limnohabitans]
MNSRLIYVMGPSGAGKDSVLVWLRKHLPKDMPVHWARRTITRPAAAGGEVHEETDEQGFETLRSQDAFALSWHANGLHYGIRRTELAGLQQGLWVLVNGSRGHLAQALQSHPGLQVVHITADPATLLQRLIQRQRETPEQIQQRIVRASAFLVPQGVIEISNNGTLDQAGQALLLALQKMKS